MLLVGDTDRIPHFVGLADAGLGDGTPDTDLYYACMDAGDDWHPEFPVGRFSAADTAVGIALVGLVSRGDLLTTIEMKINYLKPFEQGEITAEAKIIYIGSQTAIGDVDVRDSSGNLVAKAIATYAIKRKDD